MSAAWFWSVNKCGPIADSGDFVALTKKINGGTIGLEDRQKRYKAVLAAMP
jgi:putative chitinase